MAYAKLDLFASLIASKAPDDPAFEPLLIDYFPDELAIYGEARKRHRLHREIIATVLSNRIVNLTGPTFALQKRDAEGIDVGQITQAFEAAYSILAKAMLPKTATCFNCSEQATTCLCSGQHHHTISK